MYDVVLLPNMVDVPVPHGGIAVLIQMGGASSVPSAIWTASAQYAVEQL
jgi:hypothetical protein